MAADFLAAEKLVMRTGTQTSLEYFLITSVVETEFGLLETDALPGEKVLLLYTNACNTITSITPDLGVYLLNQVELLRIARLVKENYKYTTTH